MPRPTLPPGDDAPDAAGTAPELATDELRGALRRLAQLAQELARATVLLDGVVEHTSAPVYVKDADGRFLLANRALHELLDLPPGTLPGRRDVEVFPAELAAEHLANDAAVRQRGTAESFEERAPHADGTLRTYVSTKFPLPGNDGAPALVAGMSVDISDLVAVRTELAEQRQRYRALVDASGTAIVVLDAASGEYVFANPAAAELHGVGAPAALVGRYAHAHLDDAARPRYDAWLAGVLAAGRHVQERVHDLLLPPGTRAELVDVTATAVTWAGRPAVQVELRDVTGRARLEEAVRANEARLRALFALSPVGMAEVDGTGRVLAANPTLERMLGYPPGGLLGLGAEELLDEASRAALADTLARVATEGLPAWQQERTMVRRDGRTVRVLSAATVVRGPDGGVERVFSAQLDISALAAAREELELSRRQLAAAQQIAAMGSFSQELPDGPERWSDGLRELLGVPAGVAPGQELFLSLVAPDERAGVLADLRRGQAEGVVVTRDVTLLGGDGGPRVVELRGERTTRRDGTQQLFGTVQDVTTARALDRAVRAGERRARQLLQGVPDAVVVTDRRGRIEQVNDQALQMFGYTADELIGRPVELLVPPERHGAHRQHRGRYTAGDVAAVMSTGPGLVAVRKDGSRVPVEVNLAALDLPTGPAVLASVRDVTAARALQRRLTETTELMGGVLDGATEQAIVATDADGRIILFNTGAERMLGHRAADVLGRLPTFLHDRDEVVARAAELGVEPGFEVFVARARQGEADTREWTYLTSGGGRLTVALTVTATRGPDGAITGFVGVAADVTARRSAEQALRRSEQQFRLAFDDAPIGMAMVGLHGDDLGRFLRVNRAMCRITGYAEADLLERYVNDLNHPEDRPASSEALQAFRTGTTSRYETDKRYVHASGHDIWVRLSSSVVRDPDGTPAYTVSQVEDITARKQAEAQLTHQALHDALTGLPNRTLLSDHLSQALARAARRERHVGVLFIDLDDFKLVNDSLGHEAGDELLVEVAARLQAVLRDADTAARLGGDEFVIVCEDLATPAEVELVADRLEQVLHGDVVVRGHGVRLSGSVGVAISTRDSTPESLLRDADGAMYRAKGEGKGRYAVADTALRARALRQLTMEDELRRALDTGQLSLDYQPCIDLTDGRLVAVEALLRWDHPVHGRLTPDAFLDVAEDRDLIAPLGAWVLDTACRQAADWLRQFPTAAPQVWVNISSRQLGKHGLTRTVAAALAGAGLPAAQLCVEITERQVVSAAHSVQADLHALPEMGVRLAIDDFGTGHNGLDYLRSLPIDTLKIDGSFVAGLGTDRTDTALTTGLVSLARSLDLTVVAEGIETDRQRDLLRDLDCTLGQGFLLGRPGPAAAVAALCGAGPAALPPQRAGSGQPGSV